MIRRFISYYKPHLKMFCADMACALMLAACNLLFPIMTRAIMNDYIPNKNVRMMLIIAGVLVCAYVFKKFLNYYSVLWPCRRR